MKTAVIIDPFFRTVTAVEKPWIYEDIRETIGDLIDVVAGEDFSLYVDDNGLLKGDTAYFFIPVLMTSPLAGIGVLLGGVDSEGETLGLDPALAPAIVEMIRRTVQWSQGEPPEDLGPTLYIDTGDGKGWRPC